jgi:CubicO group peptidase (beta-lactamase class C family)
VGELVPTARVARSEAVWNLPRDECELDGLTFELDGEGWTVGEMLACSAVDAVAVLRDGALVWERYLNGMEPGTRHLCFSVSKSVTATLAGVLVGKGALDPSALLVDLLPELDGTSWVGATVRHLLDMRTGTRYAEVYEDREGDVESYRQVTGWRPRTKAGLPPDTYGFLMSLPADRPHGGAFGYRTPLSSMLGWVCERAAGERLPALLSRELWQPMGAEHDAAIAVDPLGNAVAGSGFCATLLDLARFGELWRLGGSRPDGTSIVPEAWVRDTVVGGSDSREAFDAQADGPDPEWPEVFYRNKWLVLDPGGPLWCAIGIHGQLVAVDRSTGVVVAMLASRPLADDDHDFRLSMAAVMAIGRALSRRARNA